MQALVAEMRGKHSAVLDCFNVGVELDSNAVSQRNAIFHIEEKCLHSRHLVCSVDRRTAEKSPMQGDYLKWFASAPCFDQARGIGCEMKRELF
jgi:hypothetical protein